MWISKIGNKSASFINHKFFHPGSPKNMEKLWLAEEKERKRKEEEEKYLKKREEQFRMHCLKKMIRKNEEEQMKQTKGFNGANHSFDDIDEKQRNGSVDNILEKEERKKYVNKTELTKGENTTVKSKCKKDTSVKKKNPACGTDYNNNKTQSQGSPYSSMKKDSNCLDNFDRARKQSNDFADGNKTNVKKDLKKKKKKKKKKNLFVDNSITAVLNKL